MANPPSAGTTTTFGQPEYYESTAADVAGGIQGMLGNQGYINQTMGNWYDTAPGQGALGQYAQYNPEQNAKFMNPYVSNVVNEQARLSNQNLQENIMPSVNSTFTGAGQFGSSRNADFINRAIRDQNYNLGGLQAQTLFNAQNAANAQQQDWTKMGLGAANQDFQNWQTQANYPLSALGQLSQATAAIRPPSVAWQSTEAAPLSAWEKAAMSTGALGTAANDGTLSNMWSMFGGNS